jgi:MerR family transcriptional regulator, thiopeptide resistance regulator
MLMETKSKQAYTVKKLANLAGVTVRTLHHYDQIGLLKPSARTSAGYRQYGEQDLLRLQQVLFFREFGMPLEDIQRVLDKPDFDMLAALEQHYSRLMAEQARVAVMLCTIEKTMQKLKDKENTMTLTDAELYEGLPKETVERWQREVTEKYDPALVAESNRRVRKMSKEQWQAIKAEGGAVTLRLAELYKAGAKPESAEAQSAIAGQRRWIEHFYTPSAEVFRGLGELYATHPEFRANYDKYAKDLSDFLRAAMVYYANHSMS